MLQKITTSILLVALFASCSTRNIMQRSAMSSLQKLETKEELNLLKSKEKMPSIISDIKIIAPQNHDEIGSSSNQIKIKHKKFTNIRNPQNYEFIGRQAQMILEKKYADYSHSIDYTQPRIFHFSKVQPPVNPPVNNGERVIEGIGLAGFICAVVGLFVVGIILGALGIVFGAISLSRFSKNPGKYKGKGFAIASLIVGIVALVGAILVAAALLAA